MRKLLLATVCLWPCFALAQNVTCPERPLNDNSNACASTSYADRASSGAVTGAITALTGDVTATGPGSVAATIAAGAVTYAKMQSVAASRLLGNPTGSPASPSEISLGATLAFSGTALQTAAGTGDVTWSANSYVTTLAWISRVAGKSETFNNSITWAGTDATTMTFPSTNGTIAALNIPDQVVSGGGNVTSQSLTTGNITVDCGSRPLQFITNGGAFTITAPANDGSCAVLVTNNASAGAIAFSGFTVGTSTGDTYATTNTQKFTLFVWRINGTAGYRWAAHQ